jgi:hypothetical protein
MPKVLWFLLEVLLLEAMEHLQHFKFLANYLRVWVVLVVEDVMVSHLLLLVQVETVIADLAAAVGVVRVLDLIVALAVLEEMVIFVLLLLREHFLPI